MINPILCYAARVVQAIMITKPPEGFEFVSIYIDGCDIELQVMKRGEDFSHVITFSGHKEYDAYSNPVINAYAATIRETLEQMP